MKIKRRIGNFLIDTGVINRRGLLYKIFSKKTKNVVRTLADPIIPNGIVLLEPSKPLSLLANDFFFKSHLSKKPRAIVVIPYFSNIEGLYNCIISLLEHSHQSYIPYSIVIANDNPEQKVILDFLFDIPEIKIIHQSQNLGFLANVNSAIAQLDSEFILLVNDDVIFQDNIIDILGSTLEKSDNIGVASSLIVGADGKIQEYGGGLAKDGTAFHHERGRPVPDTLGIRRVGYVSGCCMFFRTAVWNRLGGFNTIYSPGYYEDTQFCIDLLFKLNKFSVVNPTSRLLHYEGTTHGTDISQGVKANQTANEKIFARRNYKFLATGFLEDKRIKNSYKYNILLIDSLLPAPDLDSGSQDTWWQINALTNLNNKVFLYAADDPTSGTENPRHRYIHELISMGVECIFNENFLNADKLFERLSIKPDIIIVSRMDIAYRLIPVCRAIWPAAMIVYNTVDLHSLRLARSKYLEPTMDQLIQFGWRKELSNIISSDHTWVVSEAEQQFVYEKTGIAPFLSMTKNFPKANRYFDQERTRELVFIGSGKHDPNIHAVQKLCNLAKDGLISHRIDIYGSEQDHLRSRLSHEGNDNIHFCGYVNDLNNTLSLYRIGLALIDYGAGLNGKVLDYLAAGCDVLCSPTVAAGLPRDLLVYCTVYESGDLEQVIADMLAKPANNVTHIEQIHLLLKQHYGADKWTIFMHDCEQFIASKYGSKHETLSKDRRGI